MEDNSMANRHPYRWGGVLFFVTWQSACKTAHPNPSLILLLRASLEILIDYLVFLKSCPRPKVCFISYHNLRTQNWKLFQKLTLRVMNYYPSTIPLFIESVWFNLKVNRSHTYFNKWICLYAGAFNWVLFPDMQDCPKLCVINMAFPSTMSFNDNLIHLFVIYCLQVTVIRLFYNLLIVLYPNQPRLSTFN